MARLTPAEQIEQSYVDPMIALGDYLTREQDAVTTVDRLLRILDRDSLRDAITEVLVHERVHPRTRADVPELERTSPPGIPAKNFDQCQLRELERYPQPACAVFWATPGSAVNACANLALASFPIFANSSAHLDQGLEPQPILLWRGSCYGAEEAPLAYQRVRCQL